MVQCLIAIGAFLWCVYMVLEIIYITKKIKEQKSKKWEYVEENNNDNSKGI